MTVPDSNCQLLAAGLCVLALSGCAHYTVGTAADESDGGEEPPIAVETVAVPADWGVDGPRLTRQLVRDLRAHGCPGADWRAPLDGPVVRCVVDGPPAASFGANVTARVVARCRISRGDGSSTVRAHARETTAGGPDSTSFSGLRHSTLEYAASEALAQAARRIARRLRR